MTELPAPETVGKATRAAPAIEGGVRAARVHDSAVKHVSGAAIYTDDIPEPPGTLQVYLARSERAHARVVSMDLAAVRAADGVAAVMTAGDIPGTNDVSPMAGDDPLFPAAVVEYFGQSLFGVAAETVEQARPPRRRPKSSTKTCRPCSPSKMPWRRGACSNRPTRWQRAMRRRRSPVQRTSSRAGSKSAGRSISISKARRRWPCPARTRT